MEEIIHLTKEEYKTFQINREKELNKIKEEYTRNNHKLDWFGHILFLLLPYMFSKVLKYSESYFTWILYIMLFMWFGLFCFQIYTLYKNMGLSNNLKWKAN